MSSNAASLHDSWAKVVDQVKDRVNSRSLWEALERSNAIALEDDGTLVVGLDPRYVSLSSHLNVADHRKAIEKAAAGIVGRSVTFRLIEGNTLEDWESTKHREQIIATRREAAFERREKVQTAGSSWDVLYEQAARAFSAMALRQLPQTKAYYLSEMLYTLSDALDRLVPGTPDENSQRMLARVIERVAGNAEVPATVVALELDRLRTWQKQNPS